MEIASPIPVLAALLVALLSCAALGRVFSVQLPQGRFDSIDGLRGYLGFGVFLHHASIWYGFAKTGEWRPASSYLYEHLGQTSVYLFFAITGFLFTTKILKDGTRTDWLRLYVSRFLRLVPLYACAILTMVVIVGAVTNWRLRTSLGALLFGIMKWLMFSGADLNGHLSTGLILAKVTWTLQYEWAFYLMLPLLAYVVAKPSRGWLLVGFAGVGYALLFRLNLILAIPFLGGVFSAFLSRREAVHSFACSTSADILVAACVFCTVQYFPDPYSPIPMSLLSIAFLLIASGSKLFGVFRIRAAKVLGELTYSIYLLHGIVLYTTFRFVIGIERVAQATPFEYWCGIIALTPLLIGLTMITFLCIESPLLTRTNAVTAWLRCRLGLGTKMERHCTQNKEC